MIEWNVKNFFDILSKDTSYEAVPWDLLDDFLYSLIEDYNKFQSKNNKKNFKPRKSRTTKNTLYKSGFTSTYFVLCKPRFKKGRLYSEDSIFIEDILCHFEDLLDKKHEKLREIITENKTAIGETKAESLLKIESPQYLILESFMYFIEHSKKKRTEAKPRESTYTMAKQYKKMAEQALKTEDNIELTRLFKESLSTSNIASSEFITSSLTNNVYREKCIKYLLEDTKFKNSKPHQKLFHAIFSQITNNKHRENIFVCCLVQPYFQDHLEELTDHLKEFDNQRHLFNVFTKMCDLGLQEEVKSHQLLFTNETYVKKVNALIENK